MGGFFKRGEIVTKGDTVRSGGASTRCRSRPRGNGEPFVMAALTDEDGRKSFADTSELTRVGG